MRRGALAALAAGLTAAALTSCGTGGGSDVLTVYAAASLRAPFTEIAERFEEANPGVTVEFSFAGSSDLETQLEQGAPADVFASASTATMQTVVDAGETAADRSAPPARPRGRPTRSLTRCSTRGSAPILCLSSMTGSTDAA